YPPYMRFMAVHALHIHSSDMQSVLPYPRLDLMAGQAVAHIRLDLCVRLMAHIAVELHRRIRRNIDLYRFFNKGCGRLEIFYIDGAVSNKLLPDRFIPVAKETFFPVWFQVHSAVSMTVYAGEFFHASPVDLSVLMAFNTEAFLGNELMGDKAMTFHAFYLLNENMFCMKPGLVYKRRLGEVWVFFPVALLTDLPCNNYCAMPWRNGSLPEYGEFVHLVNLVFLVCMVALVATHALMHACSPCLLGS